jgi:hypothetical protein
MYRYQHSAVILSLLITSFSSAFVPPAPTEKFGRTALSAFESSRPDSIGEGKNARRSLLQIAATSLSAVSLMMPVSPASSAEGKSFTPGGTIVDYDVGVVVSNPEASKSRNIDNSNVLFTQDYYFKFGTAAPWIPEGVTDFPKIMPFAPSQQRYDTMKKYRERVQRGVDLIAGLGEAIDKGEYASILDSSAPEYSIRPMGLFANGFMASENTGTTNELLLARWYTNEMYLDINDIKNASSKEEATKSYKAIVNALNSYLGLMNRSITSKVGDKWDLVHQAR